MITITPEQTAQAQAMIHEALKAHHPHGVSFREVWAKPGLAFDDVQFLKVWVIYEGEYSGFDIGLLNSFDSYIMEQLHNAGIYAFPAISYIPYFEAEQVGTPWLEEGIVATSEYSPAQAPRNQASAPLIGSALSPYHHPQRSAPAVITITPEQTAQAQAMILEALKAHHPHGVSFLEVWAKPDLDFDDFQFLDICVIYKGDRSGLDIGLLNSFGSYIMQKFHDAGIDAIPAISYVPDFEAEQLGTTWIG